MRCDIMSGGIEGRGTQGGGLAERGSLGVGESRGSHVGWLVRTSGAFGEKSSRGLGAEGTGTRGRRRVAGVTNCPSGPPSTPRPRDRGIGRGDRPSSSRVVCDAAPTRHVPSEN